MKYLYMDFKTTFYGNLFTDNPDKINPLLLYALDKAFTRRVHPNGRAYWQVNTKHDYDELKEALSGYLL